MAIPLRLDLLKQTYSEFSKDKAPRLAAALAYSTIFSIAPLFIIVIAIAGTVLGLQNGGHGHHIVEDQLIAQIRLRAGAQAAESIRALVTASFSKTSQGIVAQIIGYVMFLIGASGVFVALQDSLNTVWHVEPAGKQSIWTMVRERIASLGMVLVIGFLLLVTFVLNAVLTYVSTTLTHLLPFPGAGALFVVVNAIVSVGVIAVLFGFIFKVLPDAKIDWTDVRAGAVLTSLLFVAGQYAISLYLAKTGAASAYGAAGALLVLLLWIYYSAMILLFGAEFTKVYALSRGKQIEPSKNARPITAQPVPTAAR
ncbi:MAG: YihY/virulence factor BrkB family protein [Candidatus Velthaea sp.]